ncbi:cilia- and flagella-associated protein 157-like [Leuresthes tenuis]|uniref:cilia- and flagella-associated protein 157-like n=1 Tax=Leuresthes tenuis TaxID=355514 RepID=UPI003B50CCD8
MPKKKETKSGDKQNGNTKAPKTEGPPTSASKTSFADRERDLYLTQIRYLNEELERYQVKRDELERQNKDLLCQYSTLEKEKKDIVEYLKHALFEKEKQVDELSERLDSQRQAALQDRDALLLQHSQLTKELQDRTDELAEKNTTLVERLAGLEEFQKQREELVSNMESLEKQLACQKERHKDEIHSLEMKVLLEKRRLEKKMESHVAAMEAEVQHLVTQKLPETAQLVLQENVEVKARCSRLSEQAQALMEENVALQERKSQLSVDVDILEEMLRETSRMNCTNKKVVEQLTEKCQQLETEQKHSKQQLEQLQTEHTEVMAEMEILRQDRASLSQQCSKHTERMSQMEAELQEERKRRSRMKSIMQEAAFTLRRTLMEAPTEHGSEVDSVVRWKHLMQNLLVVLDRRTLTTSSAESDRLNELQASDAAAARAADLEQDLSLQFKGSHERPSNPNHVPRPSTKQKNPLSWTGAGSSSTTVPLYRKPVGQKTSGAVNMTRSAVGFLTSQHSVCRFK